MKASALFLVFLAFLVLSHVEGIRGPRVIGEPKTNPMKLSGAAKEKVDLAPATPLHVTNPTPSTPIRAESQGRVVQFVELNQENVDAPVPPPGAVPPVEAPITKKDEAPVPPPGAVPSVDSIKVKDSSTSNPSRALESKTHRKAKRFLKDLKKVDAGRKLKPRLTLHWLKKVKKRLDIIRDQQEHSRSKARRRKSDGRRSKKSRRRRRQAKARRIVAKELSSMIRKSLRVLRDAKKGRLSKRRIRMLKGKAKARRRAARKISRKLRHGRKIDPKTGKFKHRRRRSRRSRRSRRRSRRSRKAKKVVKKPFSYGEHSRNPVSSISLLKEVAAMKAAEAKAKRDGRSPRFMQLKSKITSKLPVGVVGDGHQEMLLKTVEAVMAIDNHSAGYKGQVNNKGQLCPDCQPIVYNHDSPVSEHDKELIHKAHADLPLDDVILHAQSTLDRATLQVDDADLFRKKLLDKYPATADKAPSLIQFDIHN